MELSKLNCWEINGLGGVVLVKKIMLGVYVKMSIYERNHGKEWEGINFKEVRML